MFGMLFDGLRAGGGGFRLEELVEWLRLKVVWWGEKLEPLTEKQIVSFKSELLRLDIQSDWCFFLDRKFKFIILVNIQTTEV